MSAPLQPIFSSGQARNVGVRSERKAAGSTRMPLPEDDSIPGKESDVDPASSQFQHEPEHGARTSSDTAKAVNTEEQRASGAEDNHTAEELDSDDSDEDEGEDEDESEDEDGGDSEEEGPEDPNRPPWIPRGPPKAPSGGKKGKPV